MKWKYPQARCFCLFVAASTGDEDLRLHGRTQYRQMRRSVTVPRFMSSGTQESTGSFVPRVRTLFFIALGNFMFLVPRCVFGL
jgi:hypothetical protein